MVRGSESEGERLEQARCWRRLVRVTRVTVRVSECVCLCARVCECERVPCVCMCMSQCVCLLVRMRACARVDSQGIIPDHQAQLIPLSCCPTSPAPTTHPTRAWVPRGALGPWVPRGALGPGFGTQATQNVSCVRSLVPKLQKKKTPSLIQQP